MRARPVCGVHATPPARVCCAHATQCPTICLGYCACGVRMMHACDGCGVRCARVQGCGHAWHGCRACSWAARRPVHAARCRGAGRPGVRMPGARCRGQARGNKKARTGRAYVGAVCAYGMASRMRQHAARGRVIVRPVSRVRRVTRAPCTASTIARRAGFVWYAATFPGLSMAAPSVHSV